MDNKPLTKRRRNINRRRYRLLQDDNDPHHSTFDVPATNDVTSGTEEDREDRKSDQSALALCDKCWAARKRRVAMCLCIECNKNMCEPCANYDKQRQPRWLPFCIVQCFKFLFTKPFKSHSIVELTSPKTRSSERNSSTEIPRWALSNEASHIQRIPRVTRSSLRSNKSDKRAPNSTSGMPVMKATDPKEHIEQINQTTKDGSPKSDRRSRSRSRSFDNIAERQHHRNRGTRRTRSAERLPNKYSVVNTVGRKQLYSDNWDREPYSLHRSRGAERTNNAENEDNNVHKFQHNRNNTGRVENDNVFQTNTNVFEGNWFDEFDPWNRDMSKRRPADNYTKEANGVRERPKVYRNISIHIEEPHNKTGYEESSESFPKKHNESESTSNGKQAYIVEEPPETCPICLEDLTLKEARLLGCKHAFHTSCVAELLSRMDFDFGVKCPVCNQVTNVNNYYAPRNMWMKEFPLATEV